jgi:hypothetical protein
MTSNGIERIDPARPIRSLPLPTPREARILRALDAPISAKWKDKPLAEVLDEIKQQHQFEIWIDAKTLESEGLKGDLEVTLATDTLTADKLTVRECLGLILEPLALACVIEDDVLKLTTMTWLESTSETRIYPVGDLFTTADEANQLLETIECGLGQARESAGIRRLAVSSRMKTLTVRDTYVGQEKVQDLLRMLRDAQNASVRPKRATPPELDTPPGSPKVN